MLEDIIKSISEDLFIPNFCIRATSNVEALCLVSDKIVFYRIRQGGVYLSAVAKINSTEVFKA